jgi:uncharacterized protein (TIGR03083 family)
MDHIAHFEREVRAFEAAARRAAGAPLVPSCPGWSMADLVLHLGGVHRWLGHLIRERVTAPPGRLDPALFAVPAELAGWPLPKAPPGAAAPGSLLDWFAEGAAGLAALFRAGRPDEPVWTFGPRQQLAFWPRMQAIEAAVHRWDAEQALGTPGPVDGELAADAVAQTFEIMVPVRRQWKGAPPGSGERYRLRRTDGPGDWTVRFDGAEVRLDPGPGDVELAGMASDLMLFLWQRVPAERLSVTGDRTLLDRYFELAPPL